MQATGRGLGVLGSGVVFALVSGNDAGDTGNPVPGFGASVGITCAAMFAGAAIAILGYKKYDGGGIVNCGPCLSVRVKRSGGGDGGEGGGAVSSPPSPSAVATAATVAAKEEKVATAKGDEVGAVAVAAGAADAAVNDVEKAIK